MPDYDNFENDLTLEDRYRLMTDDVLFECYNQAAIIDGYKASLILAEMNRRAQLKMTLAYALSLPQEAQDKLRHDLGYIHSPDDPTHP